MKGGRILQRGRRWWIAFYVDGHEYRESAGTTREHARRLLKTRRKQIAAEEWIPPADRLRVTELLDSYEADLKRREKRSVATVRSHSKPIRKILGRVVAGHLTTRLIEQFQEKRLGENVKRATVDRETETLRAAFRLAYRRGDIARLPYFPMYRPVNRRTGFFEVNMFERLVASLPSDIADVARFGYLCGWRKGEIVGLRWENVDRKEREIRLDITKNGDRRTLPLEGFLWELIEQRWKRREFQVGSTSAISAFVFHRNGKLLYDFRKEWAAACKKAGAGERLFHDLRRTAVRNMVRSGVPESVAMSISGHRTRAMFDRYDISSTRDRRDALRRTEAYVQSLKESRNHGGDVVSDLQRGSETGKNTDS